MKDTDNGCLISFYLSVVVAADPPAAFLFGREKRRGEERFCVFLHESDMENMNIMNNREDYED